MNCHNIIMKQSLSNDVIHNVISSSKGLHKSIISFMFTTGFSHDKLKFFKIKDLLNACREYMANDEFIDDLLNKDPLKIIPCWRTCLESKVAISFNTSETTKY